MGNDTDEHVTIAQVEVLFRRLLAEREPAPQDKSSPDNHSSESTVQFAAPIVPVEDRDPATQPRRSAYIPRATSYDRSLTHLFPDIPATLLQSVASHSLRAADLYKLDTRDSSHEVDEDDIGFKASPLKGYPTFTSFLVPIQRYFGILHAHLSNLDTQVPYGTYFHEYLADLALHAESYEWKFIRQYETKFFDICVTRMAEGHYECWTEPHQKNVGRSLATASAAAASSNSKGKRPEKRAPDTKWNLGKCSDPCPNKRTHACKKCHKDHTFDVCPQTKRA